MMDDAELADLLGPAPPASDPAFRYDVLARVTARKARRAGLRKAAATIALFTLAGVSIPMLRELDFSAEAMSSISLGAGVLATALAMAVLGILGPSGIAQRSRAFLARV